MPALPVQPPPLSLALAALPGSTDPRAALEFGAAAGFRAVQLNLGPGGASLKPRELGRSARRDLGALLRRSELLFSGADLWIPPRHFTDAAASDRALAAAIDAVHFIAELTPLTDARAPALSLELPVGDAATAARSTLSAAAASAGVRLADHAWPPAEDGPLPVTPLGVGIDPAAVMLSGALARDADPWLRDPALAVSRLAPRVAAARLSDLGSAGRVVPGDGRLDELAYLVALSTAAYPGCLIVDLRAVANPEPAARDTAARFAGH